MIQKFITTTFFAITFIGTFVSCLVGDCQTTLVDPQYVTSMPIYSPSLPVCMNAEASCCCTRNYFTNIVQNQFGSLKSNLSSLFTNATAIFRKRIDYFQNLADNLVSKLYPIALEYAQINPETFDQAYSILTDPTDIRQKLGDIYHSMIDAWNSCGQTLQTHEAGRMCLLCQSDFLRAGIKPDPSTLLPQMQLNINVCTKITTTCYKYLQQRTDLSTYMNIISAIERMTSIMTEIDNMIKYPNIITKMAFANKMLNIPTDDFTFPFNCRTELDCPWLCQNVIMINGLNVTLAVHPSDNIFYKLENLLKPSVYSNVTINATSPVINTTTNGTGGGQVRLLAPNISSSLGLNFILTGYDSFQIGSLYSKMDTSISGTRVTASLGYKLQPLSYLVILTACLQILLFS